MQHSWDNASKALQGIAKLLDLHPEEDPHVKAFLNGVLDRHKIMHLPTVPKGTMGMMVPEWRWVMRDQDLQYTHWVAGILAVLMVYAPASAIAASVATVDMLRQLATKSGRPTKEQAHLLAALRACGRPVTIEELTSAMSSPHECADLWSQTRVERTLDELNRFRLLDGTVIPLVARDGAGTWGLAGV